MRLRDVTDRLTDAAADALSVPTLRDVAVTLGVPAVRVPLGLALIAAVSDDELSGDCETVDDLDSSSVRDPTESDGLKLAECDALTYDVRDALLVADLPTPLRLSVAVPNAEAVARVWRLDALVLSDDRFDDTDALDDSESAGDALREGVAVPLDALELFDRVGVGVCVVV